MNKLPHLEHDLIEANRKLEESLKRQEALEESIRFLIYRLKDEQDHSSPQASQILNDWDHYRGSGGQDGWTSRKGQ